MDNQKTLNIDRAKNFLHENPSKWCKIQVVTIQRDNQ